jgi:multidrug resistance efflux pump
MWYVLGNFRETLLPAIEPGMEARVNLVGYPGRTFHGVVHASTPFGGSRNHTVP